MFADRFYPRLKATLMVVLRTHVREFSNTSSGKPTVETIRRWSRDLVAAKRAPLLAMIRHGWELVDDEFGRPAGKTASRLLFEGKAAVEAGADFLTKADFSRVEKWIQTTSNGEAQTSAVRLENIFKNAAASRGEDGNTGVTPRQIAQQIIEAGLAQTEARAQMLAHTGAIWSYNEGALQRYESEGVEVVEWLTADDDLRCPFCAEMNGKRVGTREPFFRAGDKFSIDEKTMKVPTGDRGFTIEHPPLHPNCRCTLIPVLGEDLD